MVYREIYIFFTDTVERYERRCQKIEIIHLTETRVFSRQGYFLHVAYM